MIFFCKALAPEWLPQMPSCISLMTDVASSGAKHLRYGREKLLLYNIPYNIRKREASTFNRLASCRSYGSIPLCKYEIIGVIQEISVWTGFTSVVCRLDYLTILILSSVIDDEADLASWSASAFCSRGMRLSLTSWN
jgi:hypothetical protein